MEPRAFRKLIHLILIFISLTNDGKVLSSPNVGKGNSTLSHGPESGPNFAKLPGNLKPVKYNIWIRPVLEDSKDFVVTTVPGKVTITFEVAKETKKIVLHAKELQIAQADVKVQATDGNELKITGHELNAERETYTVHLDGGLKAGKNYEIEVPFVGSLFAKQTGLYGFGWPDFWEPGPPIILAASSRFAPFYAHENFPCFDDPEHRAAVEVSIGRQEKYMTLSNAKLKETTPCQVKGWVWDHYEPTPPLPISSLGVIVLAKYVSTSMKSGLANSVNVTFWAPEKFIKRGGLDFAMDLTAKLIPFYEDYFGSPFPLGKLDSVTTWHTYSPAISRLGVVTYNLAGGSVLHFPGNSPEWKRLSVATLVAQQVAHQWVGNLISPSEWSHSWLFEGIAEYVAHIALAAQYPEFKVNETFVNMNNQVAFLVDQVAKPVLGGEFSNLGINDGKIAEFDENPYPKAAAINRMLANAMTEPVLKQGLQAVFKEFAQKSISARKVLDILGTFANYLPAHLNEIEDSWMRQPGYPLVRVTAISENRVKLTQEAFKSDRSNLLWRIPITLSSAANPQPKLLWLHEKDMEITVDTSSWVIVNADATGYYRVLYDRKLYEPILSQLNANHQVFSPTTRSQLIGDYFNFAQEKYIPWKDALELTAYMHKESSLVVWTAVFSNCRHAMSMFDANENSYGLNEFLVPMMETVLKMPQLNLNKQPTGADALLQSELLRYSCKLGSKLCDQYSLKMISYWQQAPAKNPVRTDLRPIVYCAAVATGDEKIWNFLKAVYDKGPSIEEKQYIFTALTCTKDMAMLAKMLAESWKPSGPHLALQTVEAMIENPKARWMAMDSLMKQPARIGPADYMRIIDRLTEFWLPEEQVLMIIKFVGTMPDYFSTVSVGEWEGKLERLNANVKWVQTVGKEIEIWLKCCVHK